MRYVAQLLLCLQLRQLAAVLPRLQQAALDDPLWGACPLVRLPGYRPAAIMALPMLERLDLQPVLPVRQPPALHAPSNAACSACVRTVVWHKVDGSIPCIGCCLVILLLLALPGV